MRPRDGQRLFQGPVHSEMRDAHGPLVLEDIGNCPAARPLSSLCISGECALSSHEQLVPVFKASERMQITPLRDSAVKAINDRMSATSCVGAWLLGRRYNVPALESRARHECMVNFEAIRAAGQLSALSQECMESLLADGRLSVIDEESVFSAVVSWCEGQETFPTDDDVGALMNHVRFRGILDEAAERLMVHPFMSKPACMRARSCSRRLAPSSSSLGAA